MLSSLQKHYTVCTAYYDSMTNILSTCLACFVASSLFLLDSADSNILEFKHWFVRVHYLTIENNRSIFTGCLKSIIHNWKRHNEHWKRKTGIAGMKQTLDLYPDRGFASSILYILCTMDDKYSILCNISKYKSNYDCLLCVCLMIFHQNWSCSNDGQLSRNVKVS